jgi:hypothetical protein
MKLQLPPKLITLSIILLLLPPAVNAVTPAMPFSKGTTWIYEGTVAWQEGLEERNKRVRLVTQIVKVFNYSSARVAVVRSFPSELAWYGFKQHPRYSLLILSRKALLEVEADSEQEAQKMAHNFARQSRELMTEADVVMPFSLTGGRRFRSHVKGFHPPVALKSYRYIYRTNPDHTIVDFVPGLGVTSFIYEHHGTTSSVNVELKEIRRRRENGGSMPVNSVRAPNRP